MIDFRVFFGINYLIAFGVPVSRPPWFTIAVESGRTYLVIMPATGRLLYMRSWMIGYLLATLAMVYSPWLVPGHWLFLLWPVLAWSALRWRSAPLILGVLCASLVLSLRGHSLLLARLPEACNRQPFSVIGEVVSLPRVSLIAEGRRRQRFEFLLHSQSSVMCSGPRKLLLSYYGDQNILPGQRWEFQVSLRRPWGLANPGSHNMQSWYATGGIDAVGTAKVGHGRLRGEGAPWSSLHHRWRQQLTVKIAEAGLSDAAEAVVKALTVADKSGLNYEMWSLFQRYGINHLLVVSGLHIALVSGLAFMLGRLVASATAGLGLSACRWPWPECSAMAMATLYAALAGFSVATQRALLMLASFMLARLLRRQSNAPGSLMTAAFLLVLVNPLVMLSSGFWLSFSAVAALLWMGLWQKSGLKGRYLAPHLYMALVMFPVGALWFGGASWVSAPANFLMIPLVGLCVVPLSLLGAFFSLLGLDSTASTLWKLAGLPIDWLWPLAEKLAGDQALFVATPASTLSICLGLLAVGLIVLPFGRVLRGLCVVMLLPLFLARPQPSPEPQLNVLDVGQGTAVVFTVGERALLYDTGGGHPSGPNMSQSVVLPWLSHKGISALDTLMISHNDLDHSAGAADIMAALPIRQVWRGEKLHYQGRRCDAGVSWQWPGKTRFHILSPVGAQEGNNASCVLLIETPDHRYLLAGDIDVAQEQDLIRYWGKKLASDVLLVGHHGSRTSTSQAWLNQVSPRVAVIGAGYASRFGHPHQDVVSRLQGSNVMVYQTALEGAITVSTDPSGGLLVTGYRQGYKPWWM